MTFQKLMAAAAVLTSLGLTAQAHAETPWQANHPWRTHDNARLAHQNHRITEGVRDGQITQGQAHALRADDHAIRAEERADASLHGSHLTRRQQRQINRQENINSRDIYQSRHN